MVEPLSTGAELRSSPSVSPGCTSSCQRTRPLRSESSTSALAPGTGCGVGMYGAPVAAHTLPVDRSTVTGASTPPPLAPSGTSGVLQRSEPSCRSYADTRPRVTVASLPAPEPRSTRPAAITGGPQK